MGDELSEHTSVAAGGFGAATWWDWAVGAMPPIVAREHQPGQLVTLISELAY